MVEQTQLQQVTKKDPKKVEAGKRSAEYNQRAGQISEERT